MSSLRNAVQRRNHKERAQPRERSKWGLLEKHKDYSLRAKDHNVKKARLKALQAKASERNPDEFAFGMMSNTTRKGIKVQDRGVENGTSSSLGMDVVKLLKTQDAGYLSTVLQQTRREREKVREEKVLVESGVSVALKESDLGRRKRFDEDGKEVVENMLFADAEDDDSEAEVSADKIGQPEYKAKRRRDRRIEALDRQMEALKDRETKLGQALEEVQDQRARMKGTVGGISKNGAKFKVRERKR